MFIFQLVLAHTVRIRLAQQFFGQPSNMRMNCISGPKRVILLYSFARRYHPAGVPPPSRRRACSVVVCYVARILITGVRALPRKRRAASGELWARGGGAGFGGKPSRGKDKDRRRRRQTRQPGGVEIRRHGRLLCVCPCGVDLTTNHPLRRRPDAAAATTARPPPP